MVARGVKISIFHVDFGQELAEDCILLQDYDCSRKSVDHISMSLLPTLY